MSKRRIRRPKLPEGLHQATVETLLTDGRGLSHIDGKVLMIDDALPDEEVMFEYKNKKQQILEGQAKEIITASPYRVEPKCEYFGQCGGCVLQHLHHEKQIEFKQQQLLDNFTKQAKVTPETVANPLTSSVWGYRRKARLGIKYVHNKNRVLVGFRERYAPFIVDMTSCLVLAPQISELLLPISDLVGKLSTPDRIPQVEVALGDTSLALNFRVLEQVTEDDLNHFRAFATEHKVDIFLQPGNETTVYGLDHDNCIHYFIGDDSETITNNSNDDANKGNETQSNKTSKKLDMRFLPYHFTQVNFEINKKMIAQAISWLDVNSKDNVLDLFCGLGNFTLPIAQIADNVVGVEGSKPLVEWAKQNAELNNINNVEYHQADLTQDTSLMSWRKHSYNKVLIDPPRSGALEIMPFIAGHIKPEKILYVSCHPATLARDVDLLVNKYGYKLKKAGVMDMFSHTAHVESMALLEKVVPK